MTITYHIQTKTLQAISLFADSPRSLQRRPQLQGLLVEQYESGDIALIATDGHVLGAHNAQLDSTPARTTFLSNATIKELLGVAKAKKESLIEIDFTEPKNNFPDWRRFVKSFHDQSKEDRIGKIGFSAALLSRFQQAAKLLSTDKNLALRLDFGDTNNEAVLIRFTGCAQFYGLLMPMRLDYCGFDD